MGGVSAMPVRVLRAKVEGEEEEEERKKPAACSSMIYTTINLGDPIKGLNLKCERVGRGG